MIRKFTMTELVVCIAVISIVFSMLFPAVTQAYMKSKGAVCKSNLRQMGNYWKLYCNDQDHYVMPASFGETNEGFVNHWINEMIRRKAHPLIFRCPVMSEEDMFDPKGHDPQTGNIYNQASYIMNIIKTNSWNGGVNDPDKAQGWCNSATQPIRISKVTEPAEKLLIMDVIGGIDDSHSGVNHMNRSDRGVLNNPPVGTSRWVGNHHSSGFNSVFGDGHVEWLTFTQPQDWAVNE